MPAYSVIACLRTKAVHLFTNRGRWFVVPPLGGRDRFRLKPVLQTVPRNDKCSHASGWDFVGSLTLGSFPANIGFHHRSWLHIRHNVYVQQRRPCPAVKSDPNSQKDCGARWSLPITKAFRVIARGEYFRGLGERMESTPQLVLFSRTGEQSTQHGHGGSWYFRLETVGGELKLEAYDVEYDASHERLELLSVVRGLEALDQPSSVTLVTSSQQVSRAVRQGLEYWRNRNWKWERFGEKVPMKNADLWKRIDAALGIHDVRCRTIRFDQAHMSAPQYAHVETAGVTTSPSRVVPPPKFASLGPRAVTRQDTSPPSNTRVSFLFRPLIWSIRQLAVLLQAASNGLQRHLPEAANPRLT